MIAESFGKEDSLVKRERVPSVKENAKIDVFAPISPTPIAIPHFDDSVCVEFPDHEITLNRRVDILARFEIARKPGISSESTSADRRKNLRRKFFGPIAVGNRRVHRAVGTLETSEFIERFARNRVGVAIERVKRLAEFVDRVAPPV